jgi:uncharacterized RDD family membrane protein YckC
MSGVQGPRESEKGLSAMNRSAARLLLTWFICVVGVSLPVPISAQDHWRDDWDRPALRIGQNYTLGKDDVVRELAVVFGDAVLEGHVERCVVVVFGKARLTGTSSIEGCLVVVGGTATIEAGARIEEDLVIVGGGLEAPAGFSPRGQYVVIGPAALGGRLDAIVPWLTRGLLWGRPIVPDLRWVWSIVGIFFLVYLALNLVFDHPVRACAATLSARPLTAFLVGLLVLLLTGPVSVLLAVSIIGVAVVPFVLCAVFIAAILGRIGVMRWIGMRVVRQDPSESRLQSVATFVIGFGVIVIAYMVPILGLVVWTLLGVLGLGAASLAFISAYRREHPASPRVVAPPAPPAPAAPLPVQDDSVASLPNGHPSADALNGSTSPAAPPMTSDLAALPRALFRDRLAAFVLDVILVVIAFRVLEPRDEGWAFVMLLAYHIGFWTWKGTTVGGIICHIRVVRMDGAPLRFADALVRGLSSIFSLAVLGIGCLWILRDPERQAWHDKIAGTYVVRVPPNWPL